MPDQVEYYNRFGELYRDDILACPHPELWTTDYEEHGRVYKEMVERIKEQTALIDEFFSTREPVLDVGCGFGRQAIVLARKGFSVIGLDSSKTFVEIARELFQRHNLVGEFFNNRLEDLPLSQFSQIILFDVIEHILPPDRQKFLNKIHSYCRAGGTVIFSLPHVKRRITSKVNNSFRKKITQHFPYFIAREEHPYPIPTSHD
ncbi:MAG TPA: class I SAM-dependent methyltransferase, partial [Chitinophagaceae bacterium]|nr:class I SAM-dependent methyltransferase [Chitinophagaceae bacterium]